MQTKVWKLEDLVPAPYNPRKINRGDFEQLKNSLERFGAVEPILVNVNPERKGFIVGGHQRYYAALELDWKDFPCFEIDLSEDRERELNVRLNRNTGEFDFALLKDFGRDNLQEFGFSFKELNEIFKELEKEDPGERLEKMEMQPYESYDYIVLVFRNSFDWLNALQVLGIKNVDHSLVQNKKVGIGRVIDGKKILDKLEGKKANSKPGKA